MDYGGQTDIFSRKLKVEKRKYFEFWAAGHIEISGRPHGHFYQIKISRRPHGQFHQTDNIRRPHGHSLGKHLWPI